MTWISKLWKPAGYVVTGLVMAEILYHFFVRQPKAKAEKELELEIDETFFVRQPVDQNSPLTRQMKLGNDRYDHHFDVLKNLIQSAQRTIHVMMYLCSSRKLAAELIEAHKRGVKVFFVFDSSMEHGAKNSQVHALHMAGVTVKKYVTNANVTMHHKICLIDVPYDQRQNKLLPKQNSPPKHSKVTVKIPKETGVVIFGSLNWTDSGLNNNYESYHVRSKASCCEMAGREFFEIWEGSVPLV